VRSVKCSRAVRLASKYLAGELSSPNREALEEHLLECLPCARAFKTLKTLYLSVDPEVRGKREAPSELRSSIRTCVECLDHPGRRVCPRLRYRLRLVMAGSEGV
jgi:anti-sigma factor RsiW